MRSHLDVQKLTRIMCRLRIGTLWNCSCKNTRVAVGMSFGYWHADFTVQSRWESMEVNST
eukprot:285237-Amphidinium_carterae.1